MAKNSMKNSAECRSAWDGLPGLFVVLIVTASGQPRGVANQLEAPGAGTVRTGEDLQGHPCLLDHLASGHPRPGSR